MTICVCSSFLLSTHERIRDCFDNLVFVVPVLLLE